MRDAPELELRFAADFELTRGFLIGPELRGFLLLFPGDPELPPDHSVRYSTQPGLALALNATVRFAAVDR